MVFALHPDDTPGQRIARVATEALAAGPMGRYIRGDDYASFLDIWDLSDDSSRLIDSLHAGSVLAGVKTSCAVDASAFLGYAGYHLHKPWHADGSWGIHTWLGLNENGAAWISAHDAELHAVRPDVGDVLAWANPVAHVGIVVEKLGNGLYRTAEGGGSPDTALIQGLSLQQIKATNGTLCRMTGPEGKDISHSAGRPLHGFWRASLLGLPGYEEILRTRTGEGP